jgi:hypothetical protein
MLSAALFRGQILGRNLDKSIKSFPSCYSKLALQLCLEIFISSNSSNLLQFLEFHSVHCKGERRKIWLKIVPLPYGLRNPYRNLKSDNSQDYAQKPQRNRMFRNSASAWNNKTDLLINIWKSSKTDDLCSRHWFPITIKIRIGLSTLSLGNTALFVRRFFPKLGILAVFFCMYGGSASCWCYWD